MVLYDEQEYKRLLKNNIKITKKRKAKKINKVKLMTP